MSRRCPKQNHLFLNWLRANRSRFPFEPRIIKMKGSHVWGNFAGVTPAIRFQLWHGGITVDAWWNGRCWDLIGDFDVAERHSKKGYYCAFMLSEYITYYPTSEALWIEGGFEPFLEWCNEELAISRWLAIYEYGNGGSREANLQLDDKPVESPAFQELLRGLNSLEASANGSEAEREVTQKVLQMIPLFKAK